jgi:hypothetical protein
MRFELMGYEKNPARYKRRQEMHEHHVDRVHPEPIVLDIGGDVGALILYTNPDLHGREIEISKEGEKRVHVEVLERIVNGRTVFAAAYPELHQGEYHVWGDGETPVDHVTIAGGKISTLDWR